MAWRRRVADVAIPPLVAFASVVLTQTLPEPVLMFFSAWLLLSVPVGILIGHCILNGDDPPL